MGEDALVVVILCEVLKGALSFLGIQPCLYDPWLSINRVADPSCILYFFATFMIAHRQPTVAPSSALVECIVLGLSSTSPSLCIFIVILVGSMIFHAVVPLPSLTGALDPLISCPFLKDQANSTILPSSLMFPVTRSHKSACLFLSVFFQAELILI